MSIERIHDSFLASAEKRVLSFCAHRLPAFVTSDGLTLFGVGGALLAALGFAYATQLPGWYLLVIVGLGIHWFGDSLDGTLARTRRLERPRYGFSVDILADAVSVSALSFGLEVSPLLCAPLGAAVGGLFSLFMMADLLRMQFQKRHQIAVGGVGGTELRLTLMVVALVCWYLTPHIARRFFSSLVSTALIAGMGAFYHEHRPWLVALRDGDDATRRARQKERTPSSSPDQNRLLRRSHRIKAKPPTPPTTATL